jgi:hypothetical protein
MTPDVITESVFKKLEKLKFFKDMEEHTTTSVKIIMEETLNSHFSKLKPREVKHPVFHINRGVKIRGGNIKPGKKSKYKFHLMEVGDILECERRVDQLVRMAITDFVKRHQPDWKFVRVGHTADLNGNLIDEDICKFKRIA